MRKRFGAILLLGILLFNWMGYQFVYNYFSYRSELELQAKLDADNYDATDLISIQIPLSMPYGPNDIRYEKISGTIEFNGVSYQYVKRRFYHDSLELICIPNTTGTALSNSRDEFFKLVNDFNNYSPPKKSGGHTHGMVKLASVDFTDSHSLNQGCAFLFNNSFHFYNSFAPWHISNIFMQLPGKPPDNC